MDREVHSNSIDKLFQSAEYKSAHGDLLFPLGTIKDNKLVVQDMNEIPHMLIGGASGSGKTRFVQSILTCLLTKYSPNDFECNIATSNPIDYRIFGSVLPIYSDAYAICNMLLQVKDEIDYRFKCMASAEVRDFCSYNEYCKINRKAGFPALIVILDDLAKLRFDSSIYQPLQYILTNGRISGVHLIALVSSMGPAKMRNTILSSFSYRIAFKVNNQRESEELIEKKDAENLCPPYEMIVKHFGISKKLNACHVPYDEIASVLEKNTNQYGMNILHMYYKNESVMHASQKNEDIYQGLLLQSASIIDQAGYASVSILQRRLNLGYPTASKIIDRLAELELIGPFDGAKPRKINPSLKNWIEKQLAPNRNKCGNVIHKTWVVPCDLLYYDLIQALKTLKKIDWIQTPNMNDARIGDWIYMYCKTIPGDEMIMFKGVILDVNKSVSDIDDSKLSVEDRVTHGRFFTMAMFREYDNVYELSGDNLKLMGLQTPSYGPMLVNSRLADYLHKCDAIQRDNDLKRGKTSDLCLKEFPFPIEES